MYQNNASLLLQKIENTFLEVLSTLKRYPKAERYTLGEKTEKILLDATEAIYAASYSPKSRIENLEKARIQFQMVIFLFRIARRQSFISEGAYEKIAAELVEIGKMVSGWLKSIEKKNHAKNL
jgi:hypothetical protein